MLLGLDAAKAVYCSSMMMVVAGVREVMRRQPLVQGRLAQFVGGWDEGAMAFGHFCEFDEAGY